VNIRRIQRKIQKALYREQWSILVCDKEGHLLKHIAPPGDRIWADPFPVEEEGRTFIFLEQQFTGKKGTLGYIELFDDLTHTDFRSILEEPWHLSYPHIFFTEEKGVKEWWMVPESADCGQVRLYRANAFPDKWSFVKAILPGMTAVDSTPFYYEGLWWLFTSPKTDTTQFNSALFAYYASSIVSDSWEPHLNNPVVSGYGNSRMAGRVSLNTDGTLLRPAQSCVREYGEHLNLNFIAQLTPTSYKEETVRKIFPEPYLKAVCTHTYNETSRYEIRDVKTRVFAPLRHLRMRLGK